MGYDTTFKGRFVFSEKVSDEMKNYINNFSNTYKVCRDNDMIKKLYPNWKELCLNENLGTEGEFLAISNSYIKEILNESIIDNYKEPRSQPSRWCDWIVSSGKNNMFNYLIWNKAEKFYYSYKWLSYLSNKIFIPNGLSISGAVLLVGEAKYEDADYIIADNNKIYVFGAYDTETTKIIKGGFKHNPTTISEFLRIERTPKKVRALWDKVYGKTYIGD